MNFFERWRVRRDIKRTAKANRNTVAFLRKAARKGRKTIHTDGYHSTGEALASRWHKDGTYRDPETGKYTEFAPFDFSAYGTTERKKPCADPTCKRADLHPEHRKA